MQNQVSREEVAFCALWLWQNREAVSECWLRCTSPGGLISAHNHAVAFDARKLPVPKLHTMVSVMEAFHAAGPRQHLAGTSNWCAAIAQELNK